MIRAAIAGAALRKLGGSRPVWVNRMVRTQEGWFPGMIDSATEYGARHARCVSGRRNVFMAYDWVYPPRDSGGSLDPRELGHDYQLTRRITSSVNGPSRSNRACALWNPALRAARRPA